MDPSIDGHDNSVIVEESHRVAMNPKTNPRGNFYEVIQSVLDKSQWLDAAPMDNRVIKIVNENIRNPMSPIPVGYKSPAATQMLLADPESI